MLTGKENDAITEKEISAQKLKYVMQMLCSYNSVKEMII